MDSRRKRGPVAFRPRLALDILLHTLIGQKNALEILKIFRRLARQSFKSRTWVDVPQLYFV